MINYDSEEGDGQSVVVENDDHTSVFMVTRANRHHSGNYTCAPSNAKPASILVHVLNGEHPAAMQDGNGSCVLKPSSLLLMVMMAILLNQIYCCQFSTPYSLHQRQRSGNHSQRKRSGNHSLTGNLNISKGLYFPHFQQGDTEWDREVIVISSGLTLIEDKKDYIIDDYSSSSRITLFQFRYYYLYFY
ncbi:hypothetical protein SK128_003108 [Halocaridina rubra]|uniref:Ig-like domain-containing protein n=1 Tax=Halocaridina rubra TaxID=373956 RepID=A0AAN9ABU1_HALRR